MTLPWLQLNSSQRYYRELLQRSLPMIWVLGFLLLALAGLAWHYNYPALAWLNHLRESLSPTPTNSVLILLEDDAETNRFLAINSFGNRAKLHPEGCQTLKKHLTMLQTPVGLWLTQLDTRCLQGGDAAHVSLSSSLDRSTASSTQASSSSSPTETMIYAPPLSLGSQAMVYKAPLLSNAGASQQPHATPLLTVASRLLSRNTHRSKANWKIEKVELPWQRGYVVHLLGVQSNLQPAWHWMIDEEYAIQLYWPLKATQALESSTPESLPYASSRPVVRFKELLNPQRFEALQRTLKNKTLIFAPKHAPFVLQESFASPTHPKHWWADIVAIGLDSLLLKKPWQLLPLEFGLWTTLGLSLAYLPLLLRTHSLGRTLVQVAAFSLMALGVQLVFWMTLHILFSPIWVLFPAGLIAILGVGKLMLKNINSAVQFETNVQRFLPKQIFSEIKQNQHSDIKVGGKRSEITVMFVDIRGFTQMAEHLSPTEVTRLLNIWYDKVEHIASRYNGLVDKFLGDGALILFGTPISTNRHADAALKTAIELVRIAQELQDTVYAERNITFSIGISIHSGFAFVGFVGSSSKLEFTAIGDTVNTASRLQELTKKPGVAVVFSERTVPLCGHVLSFLPFQSMGVYQARGKQETLETYGMLLDHILNLSPEQSEELFGESQLRLGHQPMEALPQGTSTATPLQSVVSAMVPASTHVTPTQGVATLPATVQALPLVSPTPVEPPPPTPTPSASSAPVFLPPASSAIEILGIASTAGASVTQSPFLQAGILPSTAPPTQATASATPMPSANRITPATPSPSVSASMGANVSAGVIEGVLITNTEAAKTPLPPLNQPASVKKSPFKLPPLPSRLTQPSKPTSPPPP
ncbi:MAG: adenylate/guanylate cyclase domain-containing protein [Vampirovibrionales bacterium]